jgi:hypothetical protein
MSSAVAALAVAVLLGGAPTPSRTLVAGPALAGDRVVWGEQRGKTNVVVGAGSGALLWQGRSAWLAGPLAGSRSTVAFATNSNGCSGANTACPVETTFFARRPGHGWLPITSPVRCVSTAAGRTLAVSGPLVATVTPNCDSPSKATLLVRRDGRLVFRRTRVECCDVALAGPTLAWRSRGGVDVFDLATRRLRFRAAPPAGAPIAAFDVQADGKLAMLVGRQPDGHATLAWRSAADPTLHPLQLAAVLPGNQPRLRLIGDRLVSKPRRPPPPPTTSPARPSWYPTSPDGRACSRDSPVGSNRSAASTPPRARSPGPRAASPAHGSTARHPAKGAWSERQAPSPSGKLTPPAAPPTPSPAGHLPTRHDTRQSNIASTRPMQNSDPASACFAIARDEEKRPHRGACG